MKIIFYLRKFGLVGKYLYLKGQCAGIVYAEAV